MAKSWYRVNLGLESILGVIPINSIPGRRSAYNIWEAALQPLLVFPSNQEAETHSISDASHVW